MYAPGGFLGEYMRLYDTSIEETRGRLLNTFTKWESRQLYISPLSWQHACSVHTLGAGWGVGGVCVCVWKEHTRKETCEKSVKKQQQKHKRIWHTVLARTQHRYLWTKTISRHYIVLCKPSINLFRKKYKFFCVFFLFTLLLKTWPVYQSLR